MLFESNVLLHFFQVPWYVSCGGVCCGDGNFVFVANDWHTALLSVYLKAYYRDNGIMKFTRSILVIHNIAHQVCHIVWCILFNSVIVLFIVSEAQTFQSTFEWRKMEFR